MRETERLAKAPFAKPARARPESTGKDADTRALEQDLSAHLHMRVVIDHKGFDGGNMVITYRNLDQLDQLCQILSTMR